MTEYNYEWCVYKFNNPYEIRNRLSLSEAFLNSIMKSWKFASFRDADFFNISYCPKIEKSIIQYYKKGSFQSQLVHEVLFEGQNLYDQIKNKNKHVSKYLYI